MRKIAVAVSVILLVAAGVGVSYVQRQWRGGERFTVVTVGEKTKIESFDPLLGQGIRFELPESLEIETAGGKGKWQVKSMIHLAQDNGKQWVVSSVGDYLGVAITGERSQLGLWDRLMWWWMGRKIDWDDTDMIGEGWVEEFTDVDGARLLKVAGKWWMDAPRMFISAAVANEGLNVVVVNTAGVPGLGAHAAKTLENLGIAVRSLEAQEGDAQGCVIGGSDQDRKKLGVWVITKIWKCDWKSTGGELRIELGRDYNSS